MIADEMTAATSLFGLSHRSERELVELCRAPIVDQIAANLGLSTGHFLHLFTQHCGTTFVATSAGTA